MAAEGGGGHGEEIDGGSRAGVEHPVEARDGVVDREVLGMATTVVKPPAAAARGAGGDGLLAGLAGLAQMDVDVDETRGDDEAGGVDV